MSRIFFSRSQPSINVRISKASREHGVGVVDKTLGFLSGSLGIKISNRRNLLHTLGKIIVSISNVKEERLINNLKEHVAATRNIPGYKGVVEWCHDGKQLSTCVGNIAMDRTGYTRSYGNKHKGNEGSFAILSGLLRRLTVR